MFIYLVLIVPLKNNLIDMVRKGYYSLFPNLTKNNKVLSTGYFSIIVHGVILLKPLITYYFVICNASINVIAPKLDPKTSSTLIAPHELCYLFLRKKESPALSP